MNTQSCSAAPPPFSRCCLPTPQHNCFTSLLPPSPLTGAASQEGPFPPCAFPPPPDDLNSYFIGKMESVRQEHPGLPTTPPNSSQFVHLFPACLHVARDEVSLLLPFPLISWILWPLVFPILPFLLQFSHFFLSTQMVSNKIHTDSIISTVRRAFPLPHGVLLPRSLPQQPFPQSCHFPLLPPLPFCSLPSATGLLFPPFHWDCIWRGHQWPPVVASLSLLDLSAAIDHSLLERRSSLGFWILYAFGRPFVMCLVCGFICCFTSKHQSALGFDNRSPSLATSSLLVISCHPKLWIHSVQQCLAELSLQLCLPHGNWLINVQPRMEYLHLDV